MYDCHKDMLAFHDEKITLPGSERNEMRERRDANRNRLKDGLKGDEEPLPTALRSQGSYAMRTMVQHHEKDYDIDDGAYFDKEALKGARGADKTAADAKEMVRKALHDGKFNTPPEVRTNCVRVYYDAGYHVDVPVYREYIKANVFGVTETVVELAGTDWKRSNALSVTEWFNDENDRQSPDKENGGQLRRITRLKKGFCRSRDSWRSRIATGFMVTKLVTERYKSNSAREDRALYDTMVAIRDRLKWNLEIDHPTVQGEKLTNDSNDARTRFLRDKLDWAIDELKILFDPACTREQALKAWDSVFNTNFFWSRLKKADEGADTDNKSGRAALAAVGAAAAVLGAAAILTRRAEAEPEVPDRAVEKRGGGRYA